MKKCFMTIIGLTLLFSVAAVAAPAAMSKQQQVEKLLQVMHFDRTQKALISRMNLVMYGYMKRQHPDLPPRALRVISQVSQQESTKLLNTMNVKQTVIKVYAENLTTHEIQALINFYQTPTGQSILQKLPKVMQQAMNIYMQTIAQQMPAMQARILQELKKQGIIDKK